MKNTIENNLRVWDREYPWTRDGDEWDGQARLCGQPYEAWKQSVVETFIAPYASKSTAVLEIGPGHGRWSKEIVDRCSQLVLADLSPSCLEHCRELFGNREHVTYVVTDGRSLQGVADTSIDFIWSYDVFVHIEPEVIADYLAEIRRVLVPEGRAIVHHAGRRHAFLPLRVLQRFGERGKHLYNRLSLGRRDEDDGWRSNMSRRRFKGLARSCGLRVEQQIDRWGPNGEFGVPRYRDTITFLRRGGFRD